MPICRATTNKGLVRAVGFNRACLDTSTSFPMFKMAPGTTSQVGIFAKYTTVVVKLSTKLSRNHYSVVKIAFSFSFTFFKGMFTSCRPCFSAKNIEESLIKFYLFLSVLCCYGSNQRRSTLFSLLMLEIFATYSKIIICIEKKSLFAWTSALLYFLKV